MTQARFVHIVDDVPELEGLSDGPVMIAVLEGFLDAGSASALASDHLLESSSSRVVASFEVDEFYDYRARRPAMTFLEDLYCVGAKFKLLSGHGAAVVGCPTHPSKSKFVSSNPGLFKMTGWAHHPYGRPGNVNQGWITVYNLDTMEKGLNGVFHAYGHTRPHGIPLYLTEWDGALHTNPPDKFYSTTLKQQAIWTDQGEYEAWRAPYVKTLCQFLLVDTPPNPHVKKGTKQYYNRPTGGLFFTYGHPKPALQAFRIPIC